MKIALTTVESTVSGDEPIIHLFGRDEEQKDHHICVYGLRPFFYVPKSAPIPKNNRIVRIEQVSKEGWETIAEKQVKKIVMKIPVDVGGNREDKQGFRERFKETYEADVEFITRAAIELGIKSGFEVDSEYVQYGVDKIEPVDFKVEMRRLHVDIEVSTVEIGGRMPNYKTPICPIYSLSALDNYTERAFCFVWHPSYNNKTKYKQTFTNPIPKSLEKAIKRINGEISKIKIKYKDVIDKEFNIDISALREDLTDEENKFIDYTNQYTRLTKQLKIYQNSQEFVKNKLKSTYDLSVWTFNNEFDMLHSFTYFWKDMNPDAPTGWNFKEFDAPYLIERMKKLQMDVSELSRLRSVWVDKHGIAHIKGRIVFDTWRGYVKTLTHESENNKLDTIAKLLFGVGKVKHNGIDNMWQNNRNKLIKYNVQDVFLEYAIGVSENVFGFFYDVKCFSGCHFEDVLNNSRIVDAYMLFKAKEKKIVLPSKRYSDGTDKKSKGAMVFQAPKKGIAHWLAVLDLKSLYPNAMLSLNMGEDTIVYNPPEELKPKLIHSPIKNVYFRKDKLSFLAEIISYLINYRDELKQLVKQYKNSGDLHDSNITNRLQVVVKFITNSIFGVLGLETFRLYNRKIFANITAVGRMVIQYTVDICVKILYQIYYGDTDSIFPVLKKDNLKEAILEVQQLTTLINKKYDVFYDVFNIDKHYFLMKAEKIYKSFFMVRKKDSERVAKKRYAGHIVWEDYEQDKLEIKGFDRSDMSRVGNKIMKRILEMACYGKNKEDIAKYVKQELWKIENGKYTLEEISFSKGISKPLHTYGNQDWIRAARWTNQHSCYWGLQTNYGAGSKPKYVYVYPLKLPPQYQRIEMIALDDDFNLPQHLIEAIDYRTVIEKTIQLKIETILEAIGLSWHVISNKRKVKGLMKY